MFPEERRKKILDLIEKEGYVTINDITKTFKTSVVTVRRDLIELSNNGLIKKIYGGATKSEQIIKDSIFLKHKEEFQEEKKVIAAEAIKYISDGDTVFIDSGTTCLELAKLLTQKKDLIVITPGLHIINYLTEQSNNGNFDGQIFCTGGIWKKGTDVFWGSQKFGFFNEIIINVAFFGIVALSLVYGWMGISLDDAEMVKKVVSISKKKIGLTVSKNFDKISIAKIGDINILDYIITDNKINPDVLSAYRKESTEILISK